MSQVDFFVHILTAIQNIYGLTNYSLLGIQSFIKCAQNMFKHVKDTNCMQDTHFFLHESSQKNEHSSRGHSLNLSNDVMKSHCCLEKPWKNRKFSRIIYHRQSNHYNWWSKNTFWEQSTSFFLPSGWEMSGSIFNPFFIKETNPFFIRETFLLINMTWAWHIDLKKSFNTA